MLEIIHQLFLLSVIYYVNYESESGVNLNTGKWSLSRKRDDDFNS